MYPMASAGMVVAVLTIQIDGGAALDNGVVSTAAPPLPENVCSLCVFATFSTPKCGMPNILICNNAAGGGGIQKAGADATAPS